MRDKITYGNTSIEFKLDFTDRKTLCVKVYPDKSVQVIAPLDTNIETIKNKLITKADWIIKQQDFFISFEPYTPKRRFLSGETHLYLGKQYRLKISESIDESVKLQAGNIYIKTKNKEDKKHIEKQLKTWYEQKAERYFLKLFVDLKPKLREINVCTSSLKHRWMNKRWGTCSKKGEIILNTELIKAPKTCIEYVIIHELCHLIHLNHSKAFYSLLDELLPNWRITKEKLEHIMV